jgi:signal transduction histidine kinase
MNEPKIRVLLVDDDEDYYILMRDILRVVGAANYELSWAANYEDALAALAKPFDVCLLDYNLGECTGVDVLRALPAGDQGAAVIMLTSQSGMGVDHEAMRAGAVDFLPKRRADPTSLERAIRYAVERRRAVEALRASEQRIADLFRQEQERSRELEQAYADLRRAEAMRDDLTRMIVHDLRNPLTIIRTTLDIVGRAQEDPQVAQSLPSLLAGARAAEQRMMSMIDDLLQLSKLESGEVQLALMPISPIPFLEKKVQSFAEQAGREQKELRLHRPAAAPTIWADAELIGRVFDNLIVNAFKYSDRGGQIEVGVEDRGAMLCFYVRDDGDGIPEQYHSRIFDKYVQVGQDAAVPRRGVGLGLAFCRLAVEAHQGQIWVESRPGQGSTFRFTLPVQPLPPDSV